MTTWRGIVRQLDLTFTDPYGPNDGPNPVVVSSDYELTWQANAE